MANSVIINAAEMMATRAAQIEREFGIDFDLHVEECPCEESDTGLCADGNRLLGIELEAQDARRDITRLMNYGCYNDAYAAGRKFYEAMKDHGIDPMAY